MLCGTFHRAPGLGSRKWLNGNMAAPTAGASSDRVARAIKYMREKYPGSVAAAMREDVSKVAAGDTQIELATSNVDGDIFRAKEEEFNVVCFIKNDPPGC